MTASYKGKREGELVYKGELLEEEIGGVKKREEEFDEELEKRKIVGGKGEEKEAMAVHTPGDVISLGTVLSVFSSLLTSEEFSVFSSTDSSLSRGGRREEELLWREERVADVVLVKEREGLRGSWEREKLYWGGELMNLVVLEEGGSSWGDGREVGGGFNGEECGDGWSVGGGGDSGEGGDSHDVGGGEESGVEGGSRNEKVMDYCGNGNWKGELMLDYFLLKLRGELGVGIYFQF